MAELIRITAKQDGFRRAGITHSATPTEYPADRFTAEQWAQLQAEPMLVVEIRPEPESEQTLVVENGESSGQPLPPFDGETLREAPALNEEISPIPAEAELVAEKPSRKK